MKNSVFFRNNLISAFALSLIFSTSMVDASGSFGGGAKTIDNEKEAQYHKGKSVLRKQLLCSGCPLDGEKINKSSAPGVLQKIQAGEFSSVLKAGDDKALSVYLSRRYRIK